MCFSPALVVTLIGLATCGGRICADDAPRFTRPEGDWMPVSRELLERFLRDREQAEDAVPPAGPYIERIVYRGELQGDLSLRGKFEGVVRSYEADAVLELQHVSMFLGDLRWEGRPVEWGSMDDGRSVLLVPENTTALSGGWSLAHRIVGDRVEFRVQAPPAASSRFELTLPAGWRLDSSTGTVFPPGADGGETWVIELGRRRECVWALERADAPPATPLLLAEEQSHIYSISEDRCQIHAAFEIRVLRGPVREFRFVLPEGFQYSKTMYGGNTALSVRREQQGEGQLLIIPVPELSAGLLKPVEIDGTIPAVLEAPWQLPTISLSDARVMQSSRRLRVEMPLAVAALRPNDLRQTKATFNESGVDWFFEDLNEESALEVQLVVRRARISARVACRIDEELGDLRCDALVRLNTQSGTWYDTEFQVPPDWEVFDVVPAAGLPDSAISYWRASDDGKRLHVEFRQAASLQSPKSILIRSRAPRTTAPGESRAAPVPVPIDTDDCHVLLIVDGSRSLNLASTEPLAWAETPQSGVEDMWPTELDTLGVRDPGQRFRFFESARDFDTARLLMRQAAESAESPGESGGDLPPSGIGVEESTADRDKGAPTLALTLRSRLTAGGTDADRHEAAFHVIAGRCSESMSFNFATEFRLVGVEVDGEPAEYSRRGDQLSLSGLEPGVRTIEIHYSHPDAAPGWLSGRRLSVVPPGSAEQVSDFQWEVRMPRGYRIARLPSEALLCSGTQRLPLLDRMLGPFFEVPQDSASGFRSHAEKDAVIFTSLSPPDALTLELWNADVTRACAWAVFLAVLLVMLLLRQARVRYWQLVAVALMFVSATLAATLATVPALLSGSLFTGVVVAVLAPRRLTAVRRPPDGPSAAFHSDDRLSWTAVSVAVAAMLLSLASLCTADDEPIPNGAAAPSGQARVLFPAGGSDAGQVVYVDRELGRELAAWVAAANPEPRPLLRSARYFVSADDENVVRAEIDALVPTGRKRVRVRLPFSGVTLRSSNDCLVDGVPTPLRPATDGHGMIVEVAGDGADPASEDVDAGSTGFRRVTFRLEFRPRLNEDGTAREAGVPALIDSRLLLEGFADGDAMPEVFRAGASRQLAAGREIELGPVGELYINSEATEQPPQRAAPAGQAVSLIVLQPQHAWIRSRLEISRPPTTFGPDPTLPQVVELAGLCDIREVASPNLQAFHVSYRGSDRTIVELVFDDFDAREAVVHLDYTRPPSADGEWRFPDILEIDGIPLADNLVGIASSRGFLIDADRTAADAEGVQIVAPETFVELVADESGWPAPDVAYELTPPVALPIQLSRLETERSAGVEQKVSIADDHTRWQAVVSMNVVGAPATQHRIQLSPAVQVESVSVKQDDAERVLSWSQNGTDLVIFLTGDRTGAQQILLEGRCANGEDAPLEVPALRIPEASVGKRQTVIENRSGQIVELLNARGELSSVLPPGEGASQPAPSRTVDADGPDAPAQFRLRPRQSAFALETLVAVSATNLAVGFRSLADTGVHDWEIVIPAEWGDQFNVEPSSVLIGRQPGDTAHTVLSVRTRDAPGILTLTTHVSAPDVARWTLPTPTVRNAEITQSYLAAAPDLPFAPDAAERAGVEPDEIWQSWLDAVAGPGYSRMVPVHLAECALNRRNDDNSGKATGMLVETLLFSGSDHPAGRTTATVMTNQREVVVEFSVPDDVELLSAVSNRESVSTERDGGTARFRVVNNEPIGLAQFVLNWRSRASSGGSLFSQSLPTLSMPPVDCGFCMVVPSSAREAVVRSGLAPMDRREFRLSRAECLVRILEQVVPGHIEFAASSREVTAEFAMELIQHLKSLEHEKLDAEQAARLAAIQVEWGGIRSLMGNEWEGAAGTARPDVSPAMLAISDSSLVAGMPDPATNRLAFVNVRPALLRGMTTAALLTGLVAAFVLLRKYLPAALVRYVLDGDSMLGAAVLGLVWWLLLPLGYLGLIVCVLSLFREAGFAFRTWNQPGRSPA